MLSKLSTISVQVADQDRAVDFYVNQLGFEKTADIPMGPDERWLVVALPGAETGIVLSKGHASHMEGKFTGFIFNTDDMGATHQELSGNGVKFTVPPSSEQWGQWAQFADPDGNEFGIWAPPL